MAKVTHIDDALARVLERLDALEEENSAVTAENERLAAKVAALENSTAPPAGPPADGAQPGDHADPVVSRRGLLKRLVGAGAAGTGLLVVRDTFAPRAAFATTGPMQFGTTNDAGHDQTTLTAAPGNVATMNVANTVPFGSGLYGSGHAPSGISPPLAGGVIGDSDTLAGVFGASSTAQGVRGIGKATSGLVGLVETQSEFGTPLCGVLAETGGFENNNSALVALNGGGRAVLGITQGDPGILPDFIGAVHGKMATFPSGWFEGWAVIGEADAINNGVLGISGASGAVNHFPEGIGVCGIAGSDAGLDFPPTAGVLGDTNQASAYGVAGRNSGGVGVFAHGALAPLLLDPASTSGSPTSGTHSKGEVYVDANGVLFLCTVAGSPGTWLRNITSDANIMSTSGPGMQVNQGGTGSAVVGNVTNAASNAIAMYGLSSGTGQALKGYQSGSGIAVYAQLNNTANANPAVYANTNGKGPGVQTNQTGTGYGLLGNIANAANSLAAVRGVTNGTGPALQGAGGRVQLNLVPAPAGSPLPPSPQSGDFFVDSSGGLHYRKGGTWVTLA